MSPDEVFRRVRQMLVSEFEILEERITPAAHLGRDLDLDSIDAVTLAAVLEEETGLALTEEELKSMRTVAHITDYVSARLGDPSA
jgi:acyl carrier protein